MRRVVALCAAVLVCGSAAAGAPAGDVHVSPSGSDDNPGTAAAPFRTIQRAADAMRAGDRCIVHAGTYRQTVRPGRSGTAGEPIRFTAAEGEQVVIAGSDPVTRWSRHEGSVYKARVDWPVDQLFVGGRMMTQARLPTLGDDPYKPPTIELEMDRVRVAAPGLAQAAGTWKGGTLWAISSKHCCVAGTARITASEKGSLTLESAIPFCGGGKARGYVEGVLAALDAAGEWCQQDGAVYLWAPGGADPNTLGVEATRRRWAFDLSARSYVQVRGFRVLAAGVNMDQADHCLLAACRFRWSSFRRDIRGGFNRDGGISLASEGLGIVVGGHDNAVRDCVVAYCIGDGISVYGEDNTVANCVVHDCDLSASDCAPVAASGKGHVIRNCTIYRAGRSGLLHRKLRAGRIEHNHIHHVGLMTSDLGGTYTYSTDGGGTVLAYNRIHDVHCPGYGGSGIYIDNACANFVVRHNLCYDNQDSGIHINTPARNMLVCNNTTARNVHSIVSGGGSRTVPPSFAVTNNVFPDRVTLRQGAKLLRNFIGRSPGFVDAEKCDFRLKEGSPCIDTGTQVQGLTEGHAGKAPDQGCFEHGRPAWTAGSTLPRQLWDEGGW